MVSFTMNQNKKILGGKKKGKEGRKCENAIENIKKILVYWYASRGKGVIDPMTIK